MVGTLLSQKRFLGPQVLSLNPTKPCDERISRTGQQMMRLTSKKLMSDETSLHFGFTLHSIFFQVNTIYVNKQQRYHFSSPTCSFSNFFSFSLMFLSAVGLFLSSSSAFLRVALS